LVIAGVDRHLIKCDLINEYLGYGGAVEATYCEHCCRYCDAFPHEVASHPPLRELARRAALARLHDFRTGADELPQLSRCSREHAIERAAEVGATVDEIQGALIQSVKRGFPASEAMRLGRAVL